MKKFCFLVSGGGGPLRFFHYAIQKLSLPFQIVGVIGDRDCPAVHFAAAKGISNCVIPYRRSFPGGLIKAIRGMDCDYFITNYNKILGVDVLASTIAKFVNVHPSLLPAYAGMIGMQTVDAAQADFARFLGATTHEVIERVDAGKIIQQVGFCANWNVAIEEMYDKTFRSVCLSLLNAFVDTQQKDYGNIVGEYVFNPPCRFNATVFDEDFWAMIKKRV